MDILKRQRKLHPLNEKEKFAEVRKETYYWSPNWPPVSQFVSIYYHEITNLFTYDNKEQVRWRFTFHLQLLLANFHPYLLKNPGPKKNTKTEYHFNNSNSQQTFLQKLIKIPLLLNRDRKQNVPDLDVFCRIWNLLHPDPESESRWVCSRKEI